MKYCIEDIKYLRFKWRMFGVTLSEEKPSTYIWCDNKSILKNSSNVGYKLNKKHSEIAFTFTE